MLGADGRRRILVMLVNHGNAVAAGKAQDALVEWAINAAPQVPHQQAPVGKVEIKH